MFPGSTPTYTSSDDESFYGQTGLSWGLINFWLIYLLSSLHILEKVPQRNWYFQRKSFINKMKAKLLLWSYESLRHKRTVGWVDDSRVHPMRAGTRFESFLSHLVASPVSVSDKVETCHIALVALNSWRLRAVRTC